MPSKNIVKLYVPDGYYHVYNRGVEKRRIFMDRQDCITFLHYLKLYLSPVEELKPVDVPRIKMFIKNNMYDEIDLLAFALMPNHIHLLVKQRSVNSLPIFMRRLTTSYVMYFNRKYDRVGALFQNRYKAALISQDPYLLHLSRYIHLNPSSISDKIINFNNFTSYPNYLGLSGASWIKPAKILSFFHTTKLNQKGDSYKEFVEHYRKSPEQILGELTLEK